MSTSYSTNIIIGYIGKDLIDSGYSDEDTLYNLNEDNDLYFIDPRGAGDYEDGVIGFQIAWDFILDLNKVLEKSKDDIPKLIQELKEIFPNISKEPKLYSVLGVH